MYPDSQTVKTIISKEMIPVYMHITALVIDILFLEYCSRGIPLLDRNRGY